MACDKFIYVMQKLPQFPLPTHDVIVRGVIPVEFEVCNRLLVKGY